MRGTIKARQEVTELKAIFGSNGKVYNIVVVQDVPGLTEQAIKAARQITFNPAIKDGRYSRCGYSLYTTFGEFRAPTPRLTQQNPPVNHKSPNRTGQM